ncbi:MAG: single-stranded-DNA-specific exonuclease RecJ [Candidatus Eremiobacteraeota bacterium]|nr:single-stranded-DNA-specific exonuclease RecJ [Candidatus Eremiobacteraeota bacterium]
MNFCFEIMEPSQEKIDFFVEKLKVSPTVAKTLLNRDIENIEDAEKFINGTINDLYPPYLIDDLEKAVGIILENVEQDNKILIHGDYDADGVTSTAILIKALERIDGKVGYYIPDRFDEGYGFSPDAIKMAQDEGYSLIVTVDCGSSNYEEVKKARESGIQVIITDHHEVPENQPDADAFVNVKKPGDNYPFKHLSGAGVAIKLVSALYSEIGREDWVDFLDLAAIGTVADVVPLISENRLIVREGLKLLNKRKIPGIASLLSTVGSRKVKLAPWDISFVIAPRINAAGRLADATVALKFLLEEDPVKASELTQQLIKMNEERQKVEGVIKKEIDKMLNENPDLLSEPAWVFGSEGWHQGVIGIVASRYSESHKRPVFLISFGEDGMGRGSARCNEDYSVYEALEASRDLLIHYGGHRFAGGFTLEKKNIEKLKERVSSKELFSRMKKPVRVDAELYPDEVSLNLAREIDLLAPFGEGNPKPLFLSRMVRFQSVTTVGTNDRHLKLWISLDRNLATNVKGIAFGKGGMATEILGNDLYYDVLYNLDIDTWNKQEEISFKISRFIKPGDDCYRIIAGLEEIAINRESEQTDSEWRIVDARRVIDRRKYIRNLHKSRKKSLILTRNRRQMDVLSSNLNREGVECGDFFNKESWKPDKYIFISPVDKIDKNLGFEEIIFYHPPFHFSHFNNDIFLEDSIKRVHMLFGDEDVSREEANQEILAPGRETLLRIYDCLKKISKKENKDSIRTQPDRISKLFKDPAIKPITVIVAIKIFSDLNLLEYQKQGNEVIVTFKESGKNDLNQSNTFLSHQKTRGNFQTLKKLLLKSFLDDFEEQVHKIIHSATNCKEE